MKKSLLVLLMVLMVMSIVLTACGGGDSGKAGTTGESTIDRVRKAGKLVVGTATGYAPFEMVNMKDEFVGYDIDTAKAIGKALDVKVEFKEYSFDGLIAALQVGEIDMIISGMTITGPRALSVSFPNPYYQTKQVVLLPEKDKTTKSWKELDKKGNKIATIIGTTGQILAKANFKNAEFKDYREMPAAALAMLSGQLDAVIYDESSVRIWQKENEKSRILDEDISAENLGIAVAHNDLVTVQWLNSFLYSYLGGPQELASRSYWFESDDWYGDINTKVKEE